MSRSRTIKTIVTLAKFGISIGIIAFLVYSANRDNSLEDLWQRPKNWALLSLAMGFTMLGVLISFVRWHLLIRALDVPIQLGFGPHASRY